MVHLVKRGAKKLQRFSVSLTKEDYQSVCDYALSKKPPVSLNYAINQAVSEFLNAKNSELQQSELKIAGKK